MIYNNIKYRKNTIYNDLNRVMNFTKSRLLDQT